jgi:hypothetical protein
LSRLTGALCALLSIAREIVLCCASKEFLAASAWSAMANLGESKLFENDTGSIEWPPKPKLSRVGAIAIPP